jgi:fumarate reductase subunit C
LKQPYTEQELLSKAQAVIQELTATVSSLTEQLETKRARISEAVEKMSELSLQNSTLLSRAQELSLENENLKALNDELHKQVNLSNVEAVISAQKSIEKTEEQYRALIGSTEEKCKRKISEAEKKVRKADKGYRQLTMRQHDTAVVTWMIQLLALICCLFQNPVFFADLWDFITKPFICVWNWIWLYTEWLVTPFYYRSYGNVEALYFSTGWGWVFRILSGMLILLLSYVTGSAVIAFACYRKKEWCALSLRIAYCTLILLTGTPLFKISPFNLVLMFFIIQLLGQLIIQAGDVVFRDGRHWRKWLYIKTL